jgi:CHAT domain-containing protein
VINDQHPALSKLLFSLSSKDTLNDGYLHAYELHNLQLNTELVTLSACNTGFGKIQTGEGVMSLGRAFAYAGSPNVLMSLWSVPDGSTSKIMTEFYKHLANGMPKDVALRKAKLAYLNNADNLTSNPFYWSSFVLIGNAQPLQLQINSAFYQQGMFLWWIFMLVGIAVLWFTKPRFIM